MQTARALDRVAARRFGLITRDEALAVGIDDRAIQRRLDSGEWVRVHPGVYLVASTPRSWEQSLVAACLAAGDSAVVSHRAAALVWGFAPFRARLVEISVPYESSPRLDDVLVHRSGDLDESWIVVHEGVRVTNPLRTMLDLGAVIRHPVFVERAFDIAQGKRLITLAGAEAVLDRFGRKGRRGTGALRSIVAARVGEPEPPGVFEAQFGTMLRQLNVPPSVPEYEIRDASGRVVARVDRAFPEVRLVVEADGYGPHGTFGAFQRDRTRANRITGMGWGYLAYTYADARLRPEAVCQEIAAVYEQRRRLLS